MTRCTLLFAIAVLAGPVWAQNGSALLVTTDVECDWKLDGKPQGRLKPDDATAVPTSLGKHLLQAVSADGQDQWRSVVNIEKEGQEMVEIKLSQLRGRRGREEVQKKPTWTDPGTGSMWARRDNGTRVSTGIRPATTVPGCPPSGMRDTPAGACRPSKSWNEFTTHP